MELMHRFDAIPRKFWVLGTNTVTRTERLLCIDAFRGSTESYEVAIPHHYRHRKLKIAIEHHPDRQFKLADCRAIRISAHGVTDLQPMHEANGCSISVKNVAGGERFRIYWTFRS